MKILVTGAAGFIGSHLSKELVKKKINVIGIDVVNLEKKSIFSDRLSSLRKNKYFQYKKTNIYNHKKLVKIFEKNKFYFVINLAAEAGVRNSIENPDKFIKSNVVGFYNILELSKKFEIPHLLFASSSSVYGDPSELPTAETFNTSEPISFYASTKKSNEVMAFSYSQMYQMKITALRFFTVYGPFGRKDMAIYKFFQNIINRKKIMIYNNGIHIRDFTYIDDVIQDILSIIKKKIKTKNNFNIYNIGGGSKTSLLKLISMIEEIVGIKAKREFVKIQNGDVKKTYCNNKKFTKLYRKSKYTEIFKGLSLFYDWYKKYKNLI